MSTPQVKLAKTNRLKKTLEAVGRFWQRFIAPHPSIVDIAAQRQAQLLAGLSLALALFFGLGTIARFISSGGDFILLFGVAALIGVYILSRSRYYQAGAILIVVLIAGLAYLDILLLGSDNPSGAISSFIPLALILGSVLLPLPWMIVVVILTSVINFSLPKLMPSIVMGDIVATVGVTMAEGALFIVVIAFRNAIERARLLELSKTNDELRQASHEVQLSTQRVRTMFATLPDGIGVTDPGGLFLEVNQSMAQLAGVSAPAQLMGRSATDLIALPDRERAIQNLASGATNGRSIEYRMLTVDGREFDGELTASLLTDEQGQPAGFVAVARDISLQKQAADAMRLSEARQRQVLDSISASILITRLSDGQILYANQTMADQFGLELENLVGQATPDFYTDPQDRVRLLAALRESGRLSNYEVRAKRPGNDQFFWVDISGQTIDFGGERALLVSFIDITVRKQAETELLFRSQFERLVADISTRFVSAAVNLDEQIVQTLQAIGEFSELDRSYVFRTFEEQGVMDNTHEWCAPNIAPHQQDLQAVPLDTFPWLMAQLHRQQAVYIPRVADLPAEASTEKAEFEREAIQSLLVVPMTYQGNLFGFVGFDAVHQERQWTEDSVRLLRTVADTLAGALERKRFEQQIGDTLTRRGRQVQISTQVAQDIAVATNIQDLYERVVTQVKEQFGYYHVQVLRYSPALNAVALEVGYGEIGQQMLAQGHRLPMGVGLIGIAAATGQTVLRTNLVNDPAWQPNPLLPETQGEIAVPITLSGTVLGVLDVQSNQVGALTEEDQVLLEGLCGQIAIAIENTRLRQEMNVRLSEMDSLSRAMSAEAWRTYQSSTAGLQGYFYDQVDVQPQAEWPQALALAAQQSRMVSASESLVAEGQSLTAVPLAVRGGEVIGALGVYDDPQNPLSAEDLAFIEQVSDQLTLALESARLFDQTQTTLSQTETLYEIGRLLNNAANVDEILDAASLPARQYGCREASLNYIELDENNRPDTMTVMAVWQSDERETLPVGAVLPLSRTPFFSLIDSGPNEPRLIADVLAEENLPPPFRDAMMKAGSRAMALIPLTQAGRWLGVIIFRWSEVHLFSQAERDTYNALIGLVAPAVQSRRLLIQAQSRAQREQALRQITSAVRSSTDPAIIMRTAVREIGSILGRKALIRLEQPDVEQE